MSAQPSRWLGELDRDAMTVQVRDVDADKQPVGSVYVIDIDELSNGETYKAAAALGLNPKAYGDKVSRLAAIRTQIRLGTDWSVTNAKLIHKSDDDPWHAETFTSSDADESSDADATEQEQETEQETTAKKVPARPTGKVAKGATDLATILTGMIADISSSMIDEDKVRELIQAELRNMPAPVTQVVIGEREMIELSGIQHRDFEKVLAMVNANMTVALTGSPGTGKTTLWQQVCEAMGIPYRMLSCHPQITAVSLFGYMDAQGRYVRTDYRDAYEYGYGFLLDETDNGNGGIIAALNTAMENGHCAFPDGLVKRHDNHRVGMAMNTHGKGATAEFSGRNKLDAATLNRVTYWHVDIDERVEDAMAAAELPDDLDKARSFTAKVRVCRKNADAANLKPRVFITPRDVRDGLRLIRLGFTEKEAVECKFLAGLDETVTARITAGVRFDG